MAALPDPSVTSFVRYSHLNAAFHREVLDLARSAIPRWALDRFQSIPFAAPSAIVLPTSRNIVELAVRQHTAIVDASELRNAEAGARFAHEHARLARQNLEIAFGDKNLLSRVPGSSLIRLTPSGFVVAQPSGPMSIVSSKSGQVAWGRTPVRDSGPAEGVYARLGFQPDRPRPT